MTKKRILDECILMHEGIRADDLCLNRVNVEDATGANLIRIENCLRTEENGGRKRRLFIHTSLQNPPIATAEKIPFCVSSRLMRE